MADFFSKPPLEDQASQAAAVAGGEHPSVDVPSSPTEKNNPVGSSGAAQRMTERLLAVQLLYGMGINPVRGGTMADDLTAIRKIVREELTIGTDHDAKGCLALVDFYQHNKGDIIAKVAESLAGGQGKWESLESVLQIILSLGVGEIMMKKQAPAIVISAWVEVAKSYFGDQSPKLIHAVLDAVNKKLA